MNYALDKISENKLELVLVFLLLFWNEHLNLPENINQAIKIANYIVIGFLIIRFILINRQQKFFFYVLTRDIPLMLLVGIALLSYFWSEAPLVTLNWSRRLLISTFLGVFLATRYTPRKQMYLLSWVIGIAAIFSLAVGFAFPSYGIDTEIGQETTWRGIYAFKQYLARVMTIGAIVFLIIIFESKKARWIPLFGFALTSCLLLLSKGKTALVSFLVSISLIPLYKLIKLKYKLRTFLFAITLILGFFLIMLIFGNLETIIVDWMGKDLQFNGRTPIWQTSIEQALKRPWLGYGYKAFWYSPVGLETAQGTWMIKAFFAQTNSITAYTSYPIGHAHSGFLDLFLDLGLLGFVVFIISCSMLFARLFKLIAKRKTIEYFWMLEMIILTLLLQIAESNNILDGTNYLWIFYVSISLSSAVEYHRLKHKNIITLPKLTPK